MTNQLVLKLNSKDNDPRYRIRPKAGSEAKEDQTTVKVYPSLAERHGLIVDAEGFPTLESLEAYHRKHNPHLFKG